MEIYTTRNMDRLFISVLLLLCPPLTSPQPLDELIQYRIREEVPERTLVGDIGNSLSIPDTTETEFGFLNPNASNQAYFSLSPRGGALRTLGRLDRDTICAASPEAACDLSLDVTVSQRAAFTLVKVVVTIEDVNDNSPAFPARSHAVYISETAAANTWFALPSADDPDAGDFGIQRYELRGGGADSPFELEVAQGDVHLVVTRKLDRETQASYSLELFAFDGQDKSAAMTVDVSVLDANDNAPTFTRATYDVSVAENVDIKTIIGQVQASDPDVGANGEVTYEFSRKTATQFGGVFGIDRYSGEISVLSALDYGQHSSYDLGVVAKDQGPSSLQAYAQVRVSVRDLNDHAPSIRVSARGGAADAAPVEENAGAGAFVAHVSVTDPDGADNGKFRCQLDSPMFALVEIYETEYKMVTTQPFDRELRSSYSVNILCEDLGTPQQLSRKPLVVEVTDVNDNAPVFARPVYRVSVPENAARDARLLTVGATDADTGLHATITYSVPPSAPVAVDALTGEVTAAAVFDREAAAEVVVTVTATDGGGLTRTTRLVVTVTDVNDNPPAFSSQGYEFSIAENSAVGMAVGSVSASDADGAPHNVVTYAALTGEDTAAFSLDARTGAITAIASLDREVKDKYSFTVIARDDGGLETQAQVSMLVSDENDHAPVVTATPRPLQVGAGAAAGDTVAYVTATDADTGRNAELRFSLVSASSLFSVDTVTGAVVVGSSLLGVADTTITLTVRVSDRGSPPLATSADLSVHVNSSLPVAAAAGSAGSAPDTAVIIIVLLSVTGVVSLALVVTIVVLVRRRRRRRRGKQQQAPLGYQCHLAAATGGDDPEKGSVDSQLTPPPPPAGPRKDLYSPLNTVDGALLNGGGKLPPYDPLNLPTVHLPKPAPGGSKCRRVHFEGGSKLTTAQLKALDFPPRAAAGAVACSDQDSDRGSSDSGRGASEEETPDRGRSVGDTSHESLPATAAPPPPHRVTATDYNNRGCRNYNNNVDQAGRRRYTPDTHHGDVMDRNNAASWSKQGRGGYPATGGGGGFPAAPPPPRPPQRTVSACKVHGRVYSPTYAPAMAESVGTASVDVDGMSDGGSTTSGEYVIDEAHGAVVSSDVFV